MATDSSLIFVEIIVDWTLRVPKDGQQLSLKNCRLLLKLTTRFKTFARFIQLFPYCINILENNSLGFALSTFKNLMTKCCSFNVQSFGGLILNWKLGSNDDIKWRNSWSEPFQRFAKAFVSPHIEWHSYLFWHVNHLRNLKWWS